MEISSRRSFVRSALLGGGAALGLRSSPAKAGLTICPSPYFDVCSYGAMGDGITDDTLALQAAIDAAGVKGGIVFLPAGNYKVSNALIFNKQGVILQGSGCRSTLLQSSKNGIDVIRIISCLNVTIRDIGVYSSIAWTAGRAIYCSGSGLIKIFDTYIENHFCCVSLDATSVVIRDGYWGPSPGGTALLVGESSPTDPSPNPCSEVHVDNLVVDYAYLTRPAQPEYGVRIRSASGIWISNSDFIRCRKGLLIDPPAGSYVEFGFFTNSAWDSSEDRCMVITAGAGSKVSSLFFSNCWSASCVYDTCYIGGLVDGIQFVGHRFYNSLLGSGLYLANQAKNVMVDACFASGCANGYGYCVVDGVTRFSIRNSLSGPSGANEMGVFPPNNIGIYISSGNEDFVVLGNILKGNTLAALINGSSGSSVIASNLV